MSKLPAHQRGVTPSRVGQAPPGPVAAPVEIPAFLPGGDPSAPSQLHHIATQIRKRWLLVLLVGLSIGAAVGYVAYAQPAIYRAGSVVRLKDPRRALTGSLEDNAVDRIAGTATDPILSQVQVLRSRQVAREVARASGVRFRTGDASVPPAIFEDALATLPAADTVRLTFSTTAVTATHARSPASATAGYAEPLQLPGLTFTISQRPDVQTTTLVVMSEEGAVDRLLAGLQTVPRPRTDIIDITYRSTDPLQAQVVANETAEAFQRISAQAAQEQSRRRRMFLEGRLSEVDSTQRLAQAALSAFRSREQLIDGQAKFAAAQAGLSGLDVRRAELQAQLTMYRRLLSEASAGEAIGRQQLQTIIATPSLATNPVVLQLYDQLARYESRLDSLTATGSAQTNPDVRRTQELVSATYTRLTEALRSQSDLLGAQLLALDDLRSRSAAELRQLPQTEAEDFRLLQEIETIQRLSQQLREEYQRARISEAVEAGEVEIIDRASLPNTPVSTNPRFKTMLGLIVGLLLGAALAVFADQLKTTIQSHEDLRLHLALPELATIPAFRDAPGRGLLNRLSSWGRRRPGRIVGSTSELVTIADANTPAAEAYRSLRTNVLFANPFDRPRTLMVTSSTPSEGKTATAANLAVVFAQQGMRVVLVDADLRRPRAHLIFGAQQVPGLSQLLLGMTPEAEAITPTTVDGLTLLTAGTAPPNPAELVGSQQFVQLIARLEQQFDLVIVDSPPVLAASDAPIMAAHGYGVVLVVRAGFVHRQAAQHAVRQLAAVQARMLGVVLNDPDAYLPRQGGYYGYYSYYGTYGMEGA